MSAQLAKATINYAAQTADLTFDDTATGAVTEMTVAADDIPRLISLLSGAAGTLRTGNTETVVTRVTGVSLAVSQQRQIVVCFVIPGEAVMAYGVPTMFVPEMIAGLQEGLAKLKATEN